MSEELTLLEQAVDLLASEKKYSVNDVAEILGLSRYQLYRLLVKHNMGTPSQIRDSGVEDVPVAEDEDLSLIEQVLVLYTNDGLGLSKREVVQEMIRRGHSDVTEDLVNRILDENMVTKGSAPVPLSNPSEDGLRRAAELRDKMQAESQSRRSLEKENAALRERLSNAERFYRNIVRVDKAAHSEAITEHLERPQRRDYFNTPVYFISDIHAGYCDRNLSQYETPSDRHESFLDGIHNQNSKILTIERMFEVGKWIEKDLKSTKSSFNTAYLFILGDIFEGIFASMRRFQFTEMDAFGMEQYALVLDMLTNLIYTAKRSLDEGQELVVGLSAGNHDRLYEEKELVSRSFLIKVLADRLRAEFNEDQNVTIIMMDDFQRVIIDGCGFIIHHGDLWNCKTEPDILRLMKVYGTDTEHTVIVQAHVHRFSVTTGFDYTAITLPSIVASTAFETNNLMKFHQPGFVKVSVNRARPLITGAINV